MRKGWVVSAALLCLGLAAEIPGEVGKTPNTMALGAKESSPKARLADVAWLAGRWVGDFMGGKGEELFAPPQGEAFGRRRSLRDRRPRCFEREPSPGRSARSLPEGRGLAQLERSERETR